MPLESAQAVGKYLSLHDMDYGLAIEVLLQHAHRETHVSAET